MKIFEDIHKTAKRPFNPRDVFMLCSDPRDLRTSDQAIVKAECMDEHGMAWKEVETECAPEGKRGKKLARCARKTSLERCRKSGLWECRALGAVRFMLHQLRLSPKGLPLCRAIADAEGKRKR